MTRTESRHSVFGCAGIERNGVVLIIVLMALFRIWEAATIDLVTGEAYYLASARQLHASYFDQPPVFLWIIWLTRNLTGSEAPLVLRLPFIVMFAASTWMFYRIGARFHSERAGLFTALIANIPVLFTLSIGSWMQPEAPLTLLWLMVVWLLMDVFFDGRKRGTLMRWALIGLVFGLTFMSKYHAVFLVYGTVLFALLNRSARRWLWHPGPFLALALAAFISLPVVIWNAGNDWVSFAFQGRRVLGDRFRPDWLLRMIWGQLAYMTPWIALPALWVGIRALVNGPNGIYPANTPAGAGFFLVMLAHGPIVLFTAVAAWSDTQFHFHWQAPGYMMLFPLLGAACAVGWQKRRWPTVIWLSSGAVASGTLMVALVTHAATGWASFLLPADQQTSDPTAGALRWNALEQYFEREGILEQENIFVAGILWTECGHIDTVVRDRLPLACLSEDPRNLAFNILLSEQQGKTAYIAAVMHDDATVISTVSRFFDHVERVGQVNIMRGGAAAMPPVRIFRATNLHLDKSYRAVNSDRLDIWTLPRTQIARIAGSIVVDSLSAADRVTFWLDDQPLDEQAVLSSRHRFQFQPPRRSGVGLRARTLRVTTQSGAPVRFDSVRVMMGN